MIDLLSLFFRLYFYPVGLTTMYSKQACFCGSTLLFAQCCQLLITQHKHAQTPEQLMRSRFSAYATKEYQYIFDTYAKQSQNSISLEDIQDSAKGSHWFALIIHAGEKADSNAENATVPSNKSAQFVEFSAFYIADDSVFEMREKSRFVLEVSDRQTKSHNSNLKQWRYVDGDIIMHDQISNQLGSQLGNQPDNLSKKITRNQLCPCNHYPSAWTKKKDKKYKHCCQKSL